MIGAGTGLRGIVAKPIAVLAAGAMLATFAAAAQARVTRIVVDTKVSPAFNGASFGSAGPYETLAGRAFGELDPNDPHNAIIQDIKLAPRNARGMVEYTASFQLVKPLDMSRASRLMWHDVPNRSGRITIGPLERATGDIGLSSGWQGDGSGQTAPGPNNDYVIVPVATNPDGSPITGRIMARILNAAGPDSRPMIVHSNPVPYRPVSLDTRQATLTTHASESIDGVIGATAEIASADWAFAKCSAENPFPGTPDPTQICLKNGFDPKLLYQLVFTAKDPRVMGIGFAAFRDMASFFRNAAQDDAGTPNPVAGGVAWTITRGRSQSGNFIRGFLHLGFNQDEAGRQVYDGAWPIIAGRRIALNIRFAMPDGAIGPIRSAACRPPASSIAAAPTTPARRSSSISAPRKCGASSSRPNGSAPLAKPTSRCRTTCGATTSRARNTAAARAALAPPCSRPRPVRASATAAARWPTIRCPIPRP
jgi:hypothetical protein